MIKKTLLFCLSLYAISTDQVVSQEVISGLQSNPAVKKAYETQGGRKGAMADTLSLPFFDDFSSSSVFPDPSRWEDDFVFINNTYPKNQLSTGVATFDAIDNTGRLYESAGSDIFKADQLSSLPINLDFLPGDNVWLSFYTQPGGIADPPEISDSLTLSFYAPGEDKWYSVWRSSENEAPGFSLTHIRIDNPRFLKKGFRFRFVNYASLSSSQAEPSMAGNSDQWNLDYVVLGANRSSSDTIFHDVAFRYANRSLLKTHEAIPWKQFKKISLQEMGSLMPFRYRNNDNIVRNVTRYAEVWDVYNNTESFSFTAGAANAAPGSDISFDAGLVYTFNSPSTDSALFRIKSWLKTDDFDPRTNDTVVYYQHFGNYFAFDDGSAEAGYGINGLGSRNAMVAYRFRSYIDDTLRAISICFNDSYLNSNQRSFDLMVWDDNSGVPGNVLFTQEEMLVKPGNTLNGYHSYILTEPVPVNGIFYVGWKQRSETYLNAGLDLNTPHQGRMLYWINGSWKTSQATGSLMIRPVSGTPLQTGIEEPHSERNIRLEFWPNPANSVITFPERDPVKYRNSRITVTDLRGNEIINVPWDDTLDISGLASGFYIITERVNGIPVRYNRLIKI